MTRVARRKTPSSLPTMLLFRTTSGIVIQNAGTWHAVPETNWDALLDVAGLAAYLAQVAASSPAIDAPATESLLAPIVSQEVWAAGVTYFRSRTARMEEKIIPADFDYSALTALKTEARHRLTAAKPTTLGQAARLQGVTPADIALLGIMLKRNSMAQGAGGMEPEAESEERRA